MVDFIKANELVNGLTVMVNEETGDIGMLRIGDGSGYTGKGLYLLSNSIEWNGSKIDYKPEEFKYSYRLNNIDYSPPSLRMLKIINPIHEVW